LAWRKGLKTTYYLRSKAATQVEKSTLDINRKAIQPRWMKSESPSSRIETSRNEPSVAELANIAAQRIEIAPTEAFNNEYSNGRDLVQSGALTPIACPLDGDCEACQ
jgi:ribonucleoside-diphosphate reductase alpha chain